MYAASSSNSHYDDNAFSFDGAAYDYSYPSPDTLHSFAQLHQQPPAPLPGHSLAAELPTPISLYGGSPLFVDSGWPELPSTFSTAEPTGHETGLSYAEVWRDTGSFAGTSYTNDTFTTIDAYSPSPSPTPSSPLSSAPSLTSPSHISAASDEGPLSQASSFAALTAQALRNREQYARVEEPTSTSSTHGSSSDGGPRRKVHSSLPQKSTSRSLHKDGIETSCIECKVPIAQLNFRGKGADLEMPLIAEHHCLACKPVRNASERGLNGGSPTYAETFSGVFDAAQGVPLPLPSEEPQLRRLRSGCEKGATNLTCERFCLRLQRCVLTLFSER